MPKAPETKATPKKAPSKKTTTSAQRAKLERARQRLDREILSKVNERAALEQQLADVNSAAGKPIGNADSSAPYASMSELIEKNKGPLPNGAIRAVFREIVASGRELVAPSKVAYLGPEYSYSYLAAAERFGTTAELVPVGTIAAVFDEVHNGNVDFGLVPLENSTDGRITDTLDMFTRVRVRISGEVQLRIHHTLLGKTTRSKIKKVCSKPQALSQCRGWLAKNLPAAELVATASTTAAAERAAKDETVAAIASRQAGLNNGLKVLAANVEDNKDNITRFAVIGQSSAKKSGNDKTSMLFQLFHQPGALADAMNIFKRKRLNLTWIESFPLAGESKEYLFFVEMQGHETDLKIRQAISQLQKKTERFEVLGSYAATEPVG